MEDILAQVPGRLLEWYGQSARVLPWREEPTPYRVWVSEIMLQQTRVEAVKPYFQRFMEALPTVGDLAAAPEEQVLKLWEGLGYYSRARNLQKAARLVMERFGGALPGTVEGLLSLPGVGSYTAGAVASIAFGVMAPAVDGNVLRVVSRLLCREEDVLAPAVKKKTEKEIAGILPEGRAGDFNQAMMELGAMVCLPGTPRCGACPLGGVCRAHRLGVEGSLPVKSQKKARRVEERTVFVLACQGRAALRRRGGQGLLAGLWELPAAEGFLAEGEALAVLAGWGLAVSGLEPLPEAKHIFTHLEWHMRGWAAQVQAMAPGFSWVTGEELGRAVTLPSAFQAYRGELGKQMGLG